MPTPAATGPSTRAISSLSETSALVRARCSSSTRRGGSVWRVGRVKAIDTPWSALSSASVTKSSATSRASDATTPMTLAITSVGLGPIRSITAPVTGPSTTPGIPKATPKSETSAAVASYS